MSVYFEKTFAKKPDLIFVPTGVCSELAQTLVENGFAPQGTLEDVTKYEIARGMTGRGGKQNTFEVEMHVSCKHLTEASTYFETMLDGDFSEAQTTDSGKVRRISLKDVDPNAFDILMDILHLRTKDLAKREIDLPTLYQICILVDMYAMHVPVANYTNRWFATLKNKYHTPDILLHAHHHLQTWICISYILRMNLSFNNATAYALRHRTE